MDSRTTGRRAHDSDSCGIKYHFFGFFLRPFFRRRRNGALFGISLGVQVYHYHFCNANVVIWDRANHDNLLRGSCKSL